MKKHIKRGLVLFGTALALCLAALGWAEIKEGKGGGEVVRASAAAKLSLAPIFSDNMVLQRGREVKVFGYGESGTEVTVKFGGQESAAAWKTANGRCAWTKWTPQPKGKRFR